MLITSSLSCFTSSFFWPPVNPLKQGEKTFCNSQFFLKKSFVSHYVIIAKQWYYGLFCFVSHYVIIAKQWYYGFNRNILINNINGFQIFLKLCCKELGSGNSGSSDGLASIFTISEIPKIQTHFHWYHH